MAVGTDNIDVGAAAARGIAVGNTPDVLTDATADLAFALLLALARGIVPGAAKVRDGEWRTWEPAGDLGADLAGATLGIVGWGRIGQAVARRAEGFGMHLVHSSRSSGVPLETLLERADFVSVHTPLTPETRHLIDADALARMKPTALLVNTSRGGVVDQDALRAALHAGAIAGAALDVTDPEPLPADHPLLDAPNLLVVPHVGSATVRTRAQDGGDGGGEPAGGARRAADAASGRVTRVAVVDIGSNSTRLLVADVDGGSVRELQRESIVTRLGDGVDATGRLGDEPQAARVRGARRVRARRSTGTAPRCAPRC